MFLRDRCGVTRKKAVALRYRPSENRAPRVTAKGQGKIAEKIIELARQHDVPIEDNPDLVEILSKVDLFAEIPPEIYAAVAEILAFVYRLKGGATPSSPFSPPATSPAAS